MPLMPEAATWVATWSREQMTLKMVHDRVATGTTRVVWMAAVLWWGKQMKNLPHYYSPQTVLSKTEKNEKCFLWRQNIPEVNYFPIWISGGESFYRRQHAVGVTVTWHRRTALFCIFCFHRANWHSPTTLTEVFLCFFLSCKANVRVKLAKTGHGPHSSQLVNCVVLCIVCVDCVVLFIVCV